MTGFHDKNLRVLGYGMYFQLSSIKICLVLKRARGNEPCFKFGLDPTCSSRAHVLNTQPSVYGVILKATEPLGNEASLLKGGH